MRGAGLACQAALVAALGPVLTSCDLTDRYLSLTKPSGVSRLLAVIGWNHRRAGNIMANKKKRDGDSQKRRVFRLRGYLVRRRGRSQ